jgi:thiamine-monophosphate kinase
VTVGERGEHALIEWLRRHLPAPGPDVIVGIGDDAAVLRAPRNAFLVQTTDALVDGVHFSSRLMTPDAIGRRAVAVNLSDLAAMAARPTGCCSPPSCPTTSPSRPSRHWSPPPVSGARAGAFIVGGNITRTSGPLVVDVTVTGHVRPRRLLRRDTARAGDELWLTGSIGGAAAGLAMLEAGDLRDEACVTRYVAPCRGCARRGHARDGAARPPST